MEPVVGKVGPCRMFMLPFVSERIFFDGLNYRRNYESFVA